MSMIGLQRKKMRLGDLLIKSGTITPEQLEAGLRKQRESGKKLGEALVEMGITTDDSIAVALANQLGYNMVNLSEVEVDKKLFEMFPQLTPAMLKKYNCIPYEVAADSANILHVAMADPMDMMAMDDIGIITNMQVEPVVSTTADISRAIDKIFGHKDVDTKLQSYADERKAKEAQNADEESNIEIENSPIVQLVKSMIEQAVRQRTSDIHIEPMESGVRIRYRIDGTLFVRSNYSPQLLPAIVARIKIIGGMDISEKRKPQDGRITQVVDRQEYDIRVSVLPTVYGEKIVMRLTSKTGLTRDKADLGFNPHGILLVTGPTGSGKSTTLYTALSELNSTEVNIITVEDPVEANIDGINQVQTNNKAGLTFATALRSILRQDPDIIMIGEIRDNETASIAVQASITGHMVVSTLHTNSAASTVTRLADMGIEPYLIADSVVGIMAQRLVRRLCPACKKEYEPTEEEKELLCIKPGDTYTIFRPDGCKMCDDTGYKGRIGVYEIMELSHALKLVISKGGTADDIKEQALKDGMSTLRMSATRYVLQGITSISEMKKVSFDE